MALDQFEESRRMLVRAVAEIKDSQLVTAQRYLERVLSLPSRSDQKADAHFWLSEIASTDDEKREHLESALSYDISHHRARKSLAILDGRLKEEEIINPDQFTPTTAKGTQNREGNRFECPTCGARMIFSPDGQSLVCEHCDGHKSTSEEQELVEQEFLIGVLTAKGHQKARAMQAFECEACGAIYLLAPEMLSITCPHCDSTYSIIHAEIRELVPPEGVIPMKMDENKAEAAIQSWVKKQRKNPPRVDVRSLEGVYLPAWTFDIGGSIRWSGYVEIQEGHPVPVKDYRVLHYDDLFVGACEPEVKHFSKLLKEFNAKDVQTFKPAYIANWLAESYQVTMSDAAVNARAIAYKLAQRDHYYKSGLSDVQNLQFYSEDIVVESFKLVLVPVWIGKIVVEGQTYEVLVNGKTGKVYSDKLPGLMKKALDWLLEK